MGIQDIINGSVAFKLGLFLGKHIPPEKGYPLAGKIADILSRQSNSKMIRILKANQWVVAGGKLSPKELDQITQETMRSTARCLFDVFHYIDKPEKILEMVRFTPEAQQAFKRLQEKKATIFVAPHMSNFDMVGQALALNGYRFQVLSIPSPGKGYQIQNDLRNRSGLEITPLSLQALRQARLRLRAGGSVLTGMDRPLPDSKYKPRFFGRPAPVPVAYIRLAIEENVPIAVVTSLTDREGKYFLTSSDLIHMKTHPDLHTAIIQNAEEVLKIAEKYIQQSPQQWSMFFPVWPEAVTEMMEQNFLTACPKKYNL